MKTKLIALALLSLGITARATVYDAVNDFSLASNPNGVWSYGSLSSFTSGTFTPFTISGSSSAFTGPNQIWDSGGGEPNFSYIVKNTSSTTISGPINPPNPITIFIPPDLLNLDGESRIADVRWTAPTSDFYAIAGLFQRTDNRPQPVSIRVVENGTATLFGMDNFTTFGNASSFAFPNTFLAIGTTLDFATSGVSQPNFLSTGLKVTISTVPEPSTLTLLGAGFFSLPAWRRRAR